MPLFEYIAISGKGKKFRSSMEAPSLQDAKLQLIKEGILVLKLCEAVKKKNEKLSPSELLNLTREMARLLQAGLPLYEVLTALEEKYQKQKPHRILLSLCESLKNGISFSQGLMKHPEVFDILYTSMIANAEKTGRLTESLRELADMMAKSMQFKKNLLAALLYPAILSGFCLIVLGSLLFYVVPSLRELFEGRDLHPFTNIVFAVSQFACSAKSSLAALFILLIASGCIALFSRTWKRKVQEWVMRLPKAKTLFAKIAFVRFSRALATLLEGGLPLVQALKQARMVMRHPGLENLIEEAETKILQGASLSTPFQNQPLVPPLVSRMLGIAEEGGKLPFICKQIAQIYEEELEKTMTHFANVAQPVLLLLLGAIIGFVLLSVLLPLTDVGHFAT